MRVKTACGMAGLAMTLLTRTDRSDAESFDTDVERADVPSIEALQPKPPVESSLVRYRYDLSWVQWQGHVAL